MVLTDAKNRCQMTKDTYFCRPYFRRRPVTKQATKTRKNPNCGLDLATFRRMMRIPPRPGSGSANRVIGGTHHSPSSGLSCLPQRLPRSVAETPVAPQQRSGSGYHHAHQISFVLAVVDYRAGFQRSQHISFRLRNLKPLFEDGVLH